MVLVGEPTVYRCTPVRDLYVKILGADNFRLEFVGNFIFVFSAKNLCSARNATLNLTWYIIPF